MTTADELAALCNEMGELVHSQCPDDVAYLLVMVRNGAKRHEVTSNLEDGEQAYEVMRGFVQAYERKRMSEPQIQKPRRRN